MDFILDGKDRQVIRFPHRSLILILVLMAVAALSGCTTSLGVSGQDDLKGSRTIQTDSYSGEYEAEYKEFTGTETLFGGTGKNATIRIAGRLTGNTGSGTVLVTDGADMNRPVPMRNGRFDQTYVLDGSSFYILASGDHFSGTLHLTSSEE